MATAAERELFLASRKKGIGGSDVGAIFGVDPYRTIQDLWLDKTGQAEAPPEEPTGDQERGTKLEPIIREMYEERWRAEGGTGVAASRSQLDHPDYPWMIANVDGRAWKGNTLDHIVEIKAPSLGAYSKIKREGLPERLILQMQHYLCVTGASKGVWVIFCADRWEMLVLPPIEADLLLHEQMIEKEREFWMLVETMTPPPEIVREVKDEPEIKIVGQVVKRRDEEFTAALANLREAKQLSETASEIEQTAKARIVELIEDKPGYYEHESIGRVSYSEVEGRSTLDKKAMYAAKLIPLIDAVQACQHFLPVGDQPPMDALVEAFDQYVVDISTFEKQGKPYKTFRFTPFGRDNG